MEQLLRQKYLEHCQTFKMQCFAKKKQRKNGTRKQGTLINVSSKTQEKEAAQGNISEFFLLDTLKITFLTHYSPVLLIYNPLKHPKISRFSNVFKGYR